MARTSIKLSSYIVFPTMFGLAGVSTALVTILLTEKWLPCVIYMQIYCFALAFTPINACNLQAFNAIGRSDTYLRLEVIKRIIGTITIVIAVLFFESPIAIASTSLLMAVLGVFINAYPNKKIMNYTYKEQIQDLFPAFIAALIMFLFVILLGMLDVQVYVTFLLQITGGVFLYILISYCFKMRSYTLILNMMKKHAAKKEL